MTVYILTTYDLYESDTFHGCTTNKKIVDWWCKNVGDGSYLQFEVKNDLDYEKVFDGLKVRNKLKKLAAAKDCGIQVVNVPERYKEKFESFLAENKYSKYGTLLKRFYCSHCGFEDFDKKFIYVATYANGSTYRCPYCKEESSHAEEYEDDQY